jgi:hypothetical protein
VVSLHEGIRPNYISKLRVFSFGWWGLVMIDRRDRSLAIAVFSLQQFARQSHTRDILY